MANDDAEMAQTIAEKLSTNSFIDRIELKFLRDPTHQRMVVNAADPGDRKQVQEAMRGVLNSAIDETRRR